MKTFKNCANCPYRIGYSLDRKRCSICRDNFSCAGYEINVVDKNDNTEISYKSICPSCYAHILKTMVERSALSDTKPKCVFLTAKIEEDGNDR